MTIQVRKCIAVRKRGDSVTRINSTVKREVYDAPPEWKRSGVTYSMKNGFDVTVNGKRIR